MWPKNDRSGTCELRCIGACDLPDQKKLLNSILRDAFADVLGHHGHNTNFHGIGHRHVSGHELDPRVSQGAHPGAPCGWHSCQARCGWSGISSLPGRQDRGRSATPSPSGAAGLQPGARAWPRTRRPVRMRMRQHHLAQSGFPDILRRPTSLATMLSSPMGWCGPRRTRQRSPRCVQGAGGWRRWLWRSQTPRGLPGPPDEARSSAP